MSTLADMGLKVLVSLFFGFLDGFGRFGLDFFGFFGFFGFPDGF